MSWETNGDDREKYHEYLASREWALKRQAVIDRAFGNCERCCESPIENVHHLTYIRKYDEHLEDLQGLCRDCHQFIHSKTDVDPISLLPPKVGGFPVTSVYLAGTCEPCMIGNWGDLDSDGREVSTDYGHNWRRQITDAYYVGHKEHITPNQKLTLPSGQSLRYVGPYLYYDHNCYAAGIHKSFCLDEDDTVRFSLDAIKEADLIFVWLDRLDAFGSLVEIGIARVKDRGKILAIASPSKLHDLWFAYHCADVLCLSAQSPLEAFQSLFTDAPQWFHCWDTYPEGRIWMNSSNEYLKT